MSPQSHFISFEGGEAAGKSTQIKLLEDRLSKLGQRVIVTREPGGTPLGEAIRHLLKHAPEGRGMSDYSELLLFLASRAELVRKVITPALDEGAWVLCDRFLDSTTVYQGLGRRLPTEIIERVNAFAVGPHLPTLTLVLDLDPVEARRRLARRAPPPGEDLSDRIESEPTDFFERVRQGYHDLAKVHSHRIKIVSAEGSIEEVAEAIWKEVSHAFSL